MTLEIAVLLINFLNLLSLAFTTVQKENKTSDIVMHEKETE